MEKEFVPINEFDQNHEEIPFATKGYIIMNKRLNRRKY